MGKKVAKKEVLDEILKKIEICKEYQKADPDPTAEARLKMIENDPCNDTTYYVNVTLKDVVPEEDTSLTERKKHIEFRKDLPILGDFQSFCVNACTIVVNLNETGIESFSCSGGSFESVFSTLKSYYFNDSAYLTTLLPRKPVTGENYIKDDVEAAVAAGKKMIVYGLACISKTEVEKWLKERFSEDKFDLYNWSFENFKEAGYVDMTKVTSLEQNVNQFFENPGLLNTVTCFSMKSKIPDYNLKRLFGVYDMGYYVNATLNEIRNNDFAQGKKKYDIYSKGVFKDYLEGKYDSYLDNGGSGSWASWNDCQGQFLTFKALSPTDEELRKAGLAGEYASNLFAYEQASDLFSHSKAACIDAYWKKETDKFKKMPVGSITFSGKPRAQAQAAAEALVKSKMVDPPSMKVTPYGGTKIEFDENPSYSFEVSVPADWPGEKDDVERGLLVSKPDDFYERVKGEFKSVNKIEIKRDYIKLDGHEYAYTGVDIEIDKENEEDYTDDMTAEDEKFLIPAKSYWSKVHRRYFSSDELDNRVVMAYLSYSLLPKKVINPVKFIQHSYWTTRAPADENELKARDEFGDNALRICVDAIPYDPWDKMSRKLEKLYARWAKLGADTDDNFEFPPYDIVPREELDTVTCSKCGKTMRECQCEKIRLCSKSFPIDLLGLADLAEEDMGLFRASTSIFWTTGDPMTLAQIAKQIYHLLFPKETATQYDFLEKNEKTAAVLASSFNSLVSSQAFQIEGSMISQFDNLNYTKFLAEYAAALEKGSSDDVFNKNFAKVLQVGLMDGMIYVPTGYDIAFSYDINTHEVRVEGANSALNAALVALAEIADTDDYEKEALALVESIGEENLPTNVKKFLVYPWFPDIDVLLAAADSTEKEYIDEFQDDFIYKARAASMSLLRGGNFGDATSISLSFDIYIRKAIKCGNPICLDPGIRNPMTFGDCGLDQYFRTPLLVGMLKFDFFTEFKKRIARKKIKVMKKKFKFFEDKSLEVIMSACDENKNLKQIEEVKMKALKDLYDFGEEYKTVLSEVPEDPNASEKASLVCAAASRSKLKSVIDDYNDVFMHVIRSLYVINDDACNYTEQTFNDVMADLSTCSDAIIAYYEEVRNKAANYNMCKVKNASYIDADDNFKFLSEGMVEKEKENICQSFEKAASDRMTKSTIARKCTGCGLKDKDDEKELARLIASGDTTKLKAFIEEHKTELENDGSEKAMALLELKDNMDKLPEFAELDPEEKKLLKAVCVLAASKIAPNKTDVIETLLSIANPTNLKNLLETLKEKIKDFLSMADSLASDPLGTLKSLASSASSAAETAVDAAKKASSKISDLVNGKTASSELDDSMSKTLAQTAQQVGEMTDSVVASVNGACSDDIEKQSSNQVKKMAAKAGSAPDGENGTVQEDILISLGNFLTKSAEDYKTLTAETISFDV